MNEFTKEELEKLSILAIKFSDRFNPNDTDPLCIKIQSMIDNYCEHEMLESASNPRCVKCGVYP
jgi:hypothetical protein